MINHKHNLTNNMTNTIVHRTHGSYGIIFMLLIILVACDSTSDDELSRYIMAVKARKPKPIAPIPTFVPPAKFVYPENDFRRSPFKQKSVNTVNEGLAPNTRRPKQPLENFPLDALKFVGVLKQGSMIWGLISQPDGKISRVKVGDYMGQHFGKIITINDTFLKLEETIQAAGNWEKQVITFKLKANE